MILAKPTGISLKDHTAHVLAEAERLLSARPFYVKKYKQVTGLDLSDLLMQSITYHDKGKMHTKWQNACARDYEEFLKNGIVNGTNLMKADLRHEFASIDYCEKNKISLQNEALVAIAAHHAKLGVSFQKRLERQGWRSIFNRIQKLNNSLYTLNGINLEKTFRWKYRFSGPRALLQFCDHRASAAEDGNKILPLDEFEYRFSYEKKNRVQELAESLAEEQMSLLRAPTGAGKTDAALLWAKKQIENGRADRLVFAMPTRFTANALAIGAASKLSSTGLYHSTSGMTAADNEDKNLNRQLRLLARHLMTPVTVTTIDHLLLSLTGAEEDHHSIFFNLAHSAVIVDEADFYDNFTQENIIILLSALKTLSVPVLIMSATIPEVSIETYSKSNYEFRRIQEDNSGYERVKCSIKKNDNEDLTFLRDAFEPKTQKMILFANTIDRAFGYSKKLLELGYTPVLYHSRFTEPDKRRIEEELLKNFGNAQQNTGNDYDCAVLTQIGEMSVNISADIMISELCPADRLIQRIGRLKRFTDEEGTLFLITPVKADKLYPAPYGTYSKTDKRWQPAEAFIKTSQIIEEKKYTVGGLFEMVNTVYNLVPIPDTATQNNTDNYKKSIEQNNIVLPAYNADDDNGATLNWQSRQGLEQVKIFVNHDGTEKFRNRQDYYSYEFENTVQIPLYLRNKLIKDNKLSRFKMKIISDNTEFDIWIALGSDYSQQTGYMPQADETAFL
ncbi:MAG: CRISPR-associated helicase Cas3' [Ignavibacteriaceae bacterium]|nr:CRISPR-associated helicase Cas3' [Ignavibacteriaceae bacterium]